MSKRKALGKGLDALLPSKPSSAGGSSPLQQLPIEKIKPNAYQPRSHFSAEALDELASSIRENGLLQPIVVRPADDGYELIAGERRWRASQRAGLHRIPALIQTVSDQSMVELALVENIQREELSPIEEATAYQLLIDDFGLTQEDVAQRVSRSRSSVANTLRLLKLPQKVQEAVSAGRLSMGHARALLPLNRARQLDLAALIEKRGLSVRQVEKRVQQMLKPPQEKPPRRKDPNIRAAEESLEDRWQAKVEIRSRGPAGQIVIHYHDEEDLNRLYSMMLDRED
ncbi:MAG TPA: ParB/RepB/Spo0J family partition protein [Acidobacteriota bacterium]|nr:ParB/RepB/Spo0J family partition protein [Acidobacteriota bacterium]